MHDQFRVLQIHPRGVRLQHVGAENAADLLRPPRQLLERPPRRDAEAAEGAAVQGAAYRLLDRFQVVRRCPAAREIGDAEDLLQPLLKLRPRDSVRRGQQQPSRLLLDGALAQRPERPLQVAHQGVQKDRAVPALEAQFAVMHDDVVSRIVHSHFADTAGYGVPTGGVRYPSTKRFSLR